MKKIIAILKKSKNKDIVLWSKTDNGLAFSTQKFNVQISKCSNINIELLEIELKKVFIRVEKLEKLPDEIFSEYAEGGKSVKFSESISILKKYQSISKKYNEKRRENLYNFLCRNADTGIVSVTDTRRANISGDYNTITLTDIMTENRAKIEMKRTENNYSVSLQFLDILSCGKKDIAHIENFFHPEKNKILQTVTIGDYIYSELYTMLKFPDIFDVMSPDWYHEIETMPDGSLRRQRVSLEFNIEKSLKQLKNLLEVSKYDHFKMTIDFVDNIIFSTVWDEDIIKMREIVTFPACLAYFSDYTRENIRNLLNDTNNAIGQVNFNILYLIEMFEMFQAKGHKTCIMYTTARTTLPVYVASYPELHIVMPISNYKKDGMRI